MWKFARIIIALLLAVQFLLWCIAPEPALASDTVDITVTWTPDMVGTPVDFTATYIDANNVEITWTRGHDAVNTMVRMGIGAAPATRTDGYLVYYGVDETVTDVAIDFNLFLGEIFYRAWCEDAGSEWSAPADDSIGGDIVEAIGEQFTQFNTNLLQLFSILLVIGVVALAYWRNNQFLYAVAMIAIIAIGWQWGTWYLVVLIPFGIYTGYRAIRPWLPF